MQFGGWTQFGGVAQFGGGESRALHYYRALKSIALPGLWSQDDDALINQFLRVDAVGLSLGQVLADRLDAEILPDDASECLAEWERMLGLPVDEDVSIAARRAAVLGIWQGAQPTSLPAIRQLLGPILNPTRLFNDLFDDDVVSWRFELLGTPLIWETLSRLIIGVAAGDSRPWDSVAQDPALALIDLADRSDDVKVSAQVDHTTYYAPSEVSSGVVLYADHQNAVMAAFESGFLRLDKIVDGVLTEGTPVASPALPFWLQISKTATAWAASYGSDLDDLTVLEETAVPFLPRKGGVFSRDDVTGANTYTGFGSLEISHARPENNVEIIEQTLVNLALAGGGDEDIFIAFVHRDPGDDGEYDIAAAQRVLDRISYGHTVLLVGESDSFLCDDSESLCDRDIIGGW